MWKSGKTGVVYSGAQLTFHSLHLHKNFLPKMGKININNLMQLVFLFPANKWAISIFDDDDASIGEKE